MISQEDKIEFYNILYFSNDYKNYLDKAIWRAYRDFSRTLRFQELKSTSDSISYIKTLWESELKKIIHEVCEKSFVNQESFDFWHEKKTELLKNINVHNFHLSIGQSQKWINMTLKYLFLFGDKKIPNISNNYKYYHIPIDNIIQDRILKTLKIERIDGSWSRIETYEVYLNYQKTIRVNVEPNSAFEFEFKLFNNENHQL